MLHVCRRLGNSVAERAAEQALTLEAIEEEVTSGPDTRVMRFCWFIGRIIQMTVCIE